MGAKTTKMTHEKIAVARDKMVTKQKKPENNTKVPPQTFPAPKTIILQLYYSIVKLIVGLVENIRKMYQNELW